MKRPDCDDLLDIDSKFQRPLPESGGVKLGEEFMLDCNPPFGVPKPTGKYDNNWEDV